MPYLTYQKFNNKAAAIEMAELFNEHGIDSLLEDTSADFDPGFSFNESLKEYSLRIRNSDFEKANTLLFDVSEEELDDVDKDHPLFGFSNEELMEVVAKRDEWSPFDYSLARKLLSDSGKELKPEEENRIRHERLAELTMPYQSPNYLIILGYSLSFGFGLLGITIGGHLYYHLIIFGYSLSFGFGFGLLGITIGGLLYYHKKTLPDGSRIFAYSGRDRNQGLWILTLGIIILCSRIFYTFVNHIR